MLISCIKLVFSFITDRRLGREQLCCAHKQAAVLPLPRIRQAGTEHNAELRAPEFQYAALVGNPHCPLLNGHRGFLIVGKATAK